MPKISGKAAEPIFKQPVWRLAKGVSLIRPSSAGGSAEAILSRVPDLPGVYAWHRSYGSLLEQDSAEGMVEAIKAELAQPHCLVRSNGVGPAYEVVLQPSRKLAKEELVLSALSNDWVMTTLKGALQFSELLQSPLYVGKADKSLKRRIGQHLKGQSDLKLRLEDVGIRLHQCSLLIIESSVDAIASGSGSAPAYSEGELDQTREELALEEVLSKLFLPTFTQRYA